MNCGSSRSRYGTLTRHAEVDVLRGPSLGGPQRVGDDEERELAGERRSLDVRNELRGKLESLVR